jgi:hypothetical protein
MNTASEVILVACSVIFAGFLMAVGYMIGTWHTERLCDEAYDEGAKDEYAHLALSGDIPAVTPESVPAADRWDEFMAASPVERWIESRYSPPPDPPALAAAPVPVPADDEPTPVFDRLANTMEIWNAYHPAGQGAELEPLSPQIPSPRLGQFMRISPAMVPAAGYLLGLGLLMDGITVTAAPSPVTGELGGLGDELDDDGWRITDTGTFWPPVLPAELVDAIPALAPGWQSDPPAPAQLSGPGGQVPFCEDCRMRCELPTKPCVCCWIKVHGRNKTPEVV